MQFELTDVLIDEILFAMEDQNGTFLLDTREALVISEDTGEGFPGEAAGNAEPGRFMVLPEWDSSEGFRLMERFTAGVKNALVREKLTAALDRGKGVFRAFKDALTGHPEMEQLWFSFKEREMRRIVLDWYNGLREEWGLERIGPEPEETGDLVLEDFKFREVQSRDEAAVRRLHGLCLGLGEEPQAVDAAAPGKLFLALVTETGAGELIAHIRAGREGGTVRISALEVKPEYRGLGIGKSLLDSLLKRIDWEEISAVSIDLPEESQGFSRVLLRESFSPRATRYLLKPPAEPS
ncbi:MAG: GNAT family N-acetyltransferase [Treponema sp.]|jgi:GNAT superfamily N-acetyltransferase|nr:GNAT family N-acetyltransferase [Treponema sp.]